MVDFVVSCLHPHGGFGAAPGHDAHMLYTVSAVQILATLDAFADLEVRIPGARLKIGHCTYRRRRQPPSLPRPMLITTSHRASPRPRLGHLCWR